MKRKRGLELLDAFITKCDARRLTLEKKLRQQKQPLARALFIKAAISAAIFAGEGGSMLFAAEVGGRLGAGEGGGITPIVSSSNPVVSPAENIPTPVPQSESTAILPEVVVTGEQQLKPSSPKYTEPLRNIPQTITIIPQTVIKEQNATTLRDVLRNVSGISMQAGEAGNANPGDNFFIRGFAAGNDIFIDGVRDSAQYVRDSFNIEQVEVSKGPAGSYSGRGSTGGSVNLAAKSPKPEALREGSVSYGSANHNRITADVNQPIAAVEGAAGRLNFMWMDTGVPGRDITKNKSWGVAPSLAFGLGTPTRITLGYQYYKQDNIPDLGMPGVALTTTPAVDQSNYYGLVGRDYEKVTNDMARILIEKDFGDSLTLRNQFVRDRVVRDHIATTNGTSNGTRVVRQGQARDRENLTISNQTDLSAKVKTGPIEHALVTGVEFASELFDDRAKTFPTAPEADLYHPNPYEPVAVSSIMFSGARTETTGKSVSLYGFDTIKIGEKWEVPVGLRWENFRAEQRATAANNTSTTTAQTDKMLNWRAGLVFKPIPIGSIYAAVGNSFNPTAEILTINNVTTLNVPPEETRSYEAGTKWELFKAMLLLNAALFRVEKDNARTPSTIPGAPNVLTGKQRVDGVEVGASGHITEKWYALGSFAYMKSETLESNTATEVGDALAWTPEKSANLWTTYQLPWNINVGVGAQYLDSVARNNHNSIRTPTPSYWVFNSLISYALNKNFTFRVNVNNLADEQYSASTSQNVNGRYLPGPTRSVIVSADVKF